MVDWGQLCRLRVVAINGTFDAAGIRPGEHLDLKQEVWSFLLPIPVGHSTVGVTVAGGQGAGGGITQLYEPRGICIAGDGSLIVPPPCKT